MAETDTKLLRMLRRFFSEPEWTVLMQNDFFAGSQTKLQTLDDVERLSNAASEYLLKLDEANWHKRHRHETPPDRAFREAEFNYPPARTD